MISLRLSPFSVMRRRARLHRHFAHRQLLEERQYSAPPQLARRDHFALRVDGVNLKHVLRQIDANARDSFQILDRLAQSTASLQMGW
jgi:hypothetical protein